MQWRRAGSLASAVYVTVLCGFLAVGLELWPVGFAELRPTQPSVWWLCIIHYLRGSILLLVSQAALTVCGDKHSFGRPPWVPTPGEVPWRSRWE